MTTLAQDIQTLLTSLAPAGGVYQLVNTQQPPTYPYIVWQRVASTPNVSLRGPSDLQNTQLQVSVFDVQMPRAETLADAVSAAFAAWAVQNTPTLSFDLFEPDTRCAHLVREFSIWAKN